MPNQYTGRGAFDRAELGILTLNGLDMSQARTVGAELVGQYVLLSNGSQNLSLNSNVSVGSFITFRNLGGTAINIPTISGASVASNGTTVVMFTNSGWITL